MFFLLFTVQIVYATLTTRIGSPLPALLVYPHNTNIYTGFDHRFLNVTETPLDVGRFRRLLEIQSSIQTLENPAISIDVRAELAQKCIRDFFLDAAAPPTNAQLWQQWLSDGLEWP